MGEKEAGVSAISLAQAGLRSPGRRRVAARIGLGLAMAAATVYTAFPFYMLVVSSLTSSTTLFSGSAWPTAWSAASYGHLFSTAPVVGYLANSLIVALAVTLLTVIVSVLAAYSLAFLTYRFRDALGRLILFTYMFPAVIIVVPSYDIMSRLGLTNNLGGVILIELILSVPFCVWMLRSFFLQIPKDLEEAAMIDGASRMRALITVLVPVARPGIIAVGVFAFIFSWNEYLFPLVLINQDADKTLPLAIAGFMGNLTIDWPSLLASGVVATVPVLILFIFLQRYLVAGLTSGAVKG
jgi:ABC-type glycerol-3-phosphate transport system permease component